MVSPQGWYNPIAASVGQAQAGVDPLLLLPARLDLVGSRLELQRQLLLAGQPRRTPIKVTAEGVIWDGHHAVRAAAEEGQVIDVLVVADLQPPSGLTILQLPVG